ncbi:MAG: hypothetical protein ABH860_01270, partial [bacterium]
YDVAGRIDAPNLLGKDWGIPFFKLYPWISYKRGAELLGVASGPSIAEMVGALKNEKPIEYSTVSGGISAELDILSEKFKLGAEFLKESSQMQRSRSVSAYELTWRGVTLGYQATDNPIRYYTGNTSPSERQEKIELKFDPRSLGAAGQLIPSVSVGRQVTNAGGSKKDDYTYFKVNFSLGRPVGNSWENDSLLKDAGRVKHIFGNNIYAFEDQAEKIKGGK